MSEVVPIPERLKKFFELLIQAQDQLLFIQSDEEAQIALEIVGQFLNGIERNVRGFKTKLNEL